MRQNKWSRVFLFVVVLLCGENGKVGSFRIGKMTGGGGPKPPAPVVARPSGGSMPPRMGAPYAAGSRMSSPSTSYIPGMSPGFGGPPKRISSSSSLVSGPMNQLVPYKPSPFQSQSSFGTAMSSSPSSFKKPGTSGFGPSSASSLTPGPMNQLVPYKPSPSLGSLVPTYSKPGLTGSRVTSPVTSSSSLTTGPMNQLVPYKKPVISGQSGPTLGSTSSILNRPLGSGTASITGSSSSLSGPSNSLFRPPSTPSSALILHPQLSSSASKYNQLVPTSSTLFRPPSTPSSALILHPQLSSSASKYNQLVPTSSSNLFRPPSTPSSALILHPQLSSSASKYNQLVTTPPTPSLSSSAAGGAVAKPPSTGKIVAGAALAGVGASMLTTSLMHRPPMMNYGQSMLPSTGMLGQSTSFQPSLSSSFLSSPSLSSQSFSSPSFSFPSVSSPSFSSSPFSSPSFSSPSLSSASTSSQSLSPSSPLTPSQSESTAVEQPNNMLPSPPQGQDPVASMFGDSLLTTLNNAAMMQQQSLMMGGGYPMNTYGSSPYMYNPNGNMGYGSPYGQSGMLGSSIGGLGIQDPLGGSIMQGPVGGIQDPMGGVQDPMGGVQDPMGGVQDPMGGVQDPMGGVQDPMGGFQDPLGGSTMHGPMGDTFGGPGIGDALGVSPILDPLGDPAIHDPLGGAAIHDPLSASATDDPLGPPVVYGPPVCRDEQNNPVAWFILYKLPETPDFVLDTPYIFTTNVRAAAAGAGSPWTFIQNGFEFMDYGAPALQHTLRPLEAPPPETTFAIYNDQPTDELPAGRTYAHSKGVLAKSGDHGFLLTHSLPKFPQLTEGRIDEYSIKFGQIAMCVSFDATRHWDNVRQYVANLKPKIVQSGGHWGPVERDNTESFEIQATDRTNFRLFAKTREQVRQSREIYRDILAPYYNEDFDVASWRLGAGDRIEADCHQRIENRVVDDVQTVSVTVEGETHTWVTSKDHSKWAVSRMGGQREVFCVGDMNRFRSQTERPGGAVCMENVPRITQAFQGMVAETECVDRATWRGRV